MAQQFLPIKQQVNNTTKQSCLQKQEECVSERRKLQLSSMLQFTLRTKLILWVLSLFHVFDVKDAQYAGKLFIDLLCCLYCKDLSSPTILSLQLLSNTNQCVLALKTSVVFGLRSIMLGNNFCSLFISFSRYFVK